MRTSCANIALDHALYSSFLSMLLQLSVNAHKLDTTQMKDSNISATAVDPVHHFFCMHEDLHKVSMFSPHNTCTTTQSQRL